MTSPTLDAKNAKNAKNAIDAKPPVRSLVIRLIRLIRLITLGLSRGAKNKPPRTGGTACILVIGRLLRHGALLESLIIESSNCLFGIEGRGLVDLTDGQTCLEFDLHLLHTR